MRLFPRSFPIVGRATLLAFLLLLPLSSARAGFERLVGALETPLAAKILVSSEARRTFESALVQLELLGLGAVPPGNARQPSGLARLLRGLKPQQLVHAERVYELRELESNLLSIEGRLRASGLLTGEKAALSAAAEAEALASAGRLFLADAGAVEFVGRRSPLRLLRPGREGRGGLAELAKAFLMDGASAKAGEAARSAHRSITEDLFHGQVSHIERFSANGNRNPIYKVRLHNPVTGRVRDALFKPRPFGDGDGWNRTPMEYVTYEVQRLLGMDYIPPAAYRRGLSLEGGVSEGAMLYMVPEAHALHPVPRSEWGTDVRLMLSDTRVLDTLMMNPDRHINNFLRGRHWVDGSFRPMLIDHASALRASTRTSLSHSDAFNMGATRVIRKSTWDALNALRRSDLERFGAFISPGEMDGIVARRHQIIDYFNQLITERGYVNVVVDAR